LIPFVKVSNKSAEHLLGILSVLGSPIYPSRDGIRTSASDFLVICQNHARVSMFNAHTEESLFSKTVISFVRIIRSDDSPIRLLSKCSDKLKLAGSALSVIPQNDAESL
jgi:hypothetical protein